MRVLMINSFFSVGGPPRIMNGIYDALKKQGHDCKIAAAREKKYVSDDSIQIGNTLDVYRNALEARLWDNDGLCAKNSTRKLIREIERYDPDIIQLHNLHGYYINIEVLFDFLKRYGKPVVWTLHDCWAMTGHCCHFDYVKCDKWKSECHHCQQTKEYPNCYGSDRSKRNFRKKKTSFTNVPNMTIVTVSKWLKNIVKQSFLSLYPVEVVSNGINLNIFHYTDSSIREKYNLGDKKVILGVAQNWGEKKGLNDFIKLADKLDESYRLVLIGISSKLADSMPKNILTIPQTNNSKELAEWYSAADAFLNLSYEETFGLVTLEAMACGTPVIVYDRTAVPEVVGKNCGKVIHAGDIDAIVDSLASIEKTKCSSLCSQHAFEYDNTIKYNEYIALYKKLLMENS